MIRITEAEMLKYQGEFDQSLYNLGTNQNRIFEDFLAQT